MSQPKGHTIPLSLPRRQVCDLLHFATRIPTVPVERILRIDAAAQAREQASPRPGWCSLFTKAWAIVCARQPALRRAYLSYPWPRLYQHPVNVATVAIERRFSDDEEGVLFHLITRPEEKALVEINTRIKGFKDLPLASAAVLRRQFRIATYPRPLRRLLWSTGLNWNGRVRARFFGTFSVSSYSASGAQSLHPLSVLTSTLNYGTVEPDGRVMTRVVYDHRTLDGSVVGRAMGELERVLQNDITAELRYLAKLDAA